MLQVNYIRENKAQVLERLAVRNFKQPELIDEIIRIDENRRATQTQLDQLSAEANVAAKQIGELMRAGNKAEAEIIKAASAGFKEQIKQLSEQLSGLEAALYDNIILLPNLPHHSVPAGQTPEDNEVVLQYGEAPVLPENALPHWELA